MNDDQFEILDEPEAEPRKQKRKPKSRPLGIPWRWVLAAFAAGVGVVLLFMVASMRLSPVVPGPPILATPATLPTVSASSGEYVEDVAWHGDTMAAATLSRLGIYEDLNWSQNLNAYEFDNKARDNFMDMAFSPDGTQLAAIQSEYWFENGALMPAAYVSIWNNGESAIEFMAHGGNDGGFTTRYLGVAVAYSPDGRLLATGAGKGEIKFWDTADYHPIGSIFTSATATVGLAFSDDGQHLTALLRGDDGSTDTNWADSGSIQVWDIRNPQNPVKEPFTRYLHREVGLKAAISPNGQFVAFADLLEENQCCYADSLQIWDVHAGSLVMEIPLDERGSTIENVAFSQDSDSLTFVEQHIIEQDRYGIPQNDLRVFGWQKGADGRYQIQDMGSTKFNIDSMPYDLHVNDDGTWVQYITSPYNTVERWYIGTDQVQDMAL